MISRSKKSGSYWRGREYYIDLALRVLNACPLRLSRNIRGDCVELSDCPISRSKFFGRTYELDQTSKILDPAHKGQKRCLLWGLPGFGKTRIALRYKELSGSLYEAVIWVDASTPESALESFSQAAASIGAKFTSHISSSSSSVTRDREDVFIVKRWLERQSMNWLMIVDSIDELEEFDARRFLPKCSHGAILATSSHAGLAKAWDMQSIEISEIDKVSGIELLLDWIDVQCHSPEGKWYGPTNP